VHYVVAALYELGEPGTGTVYTRVSDANQDCVEAELPEGFVTLELVAPSELVTFGRSAGVMTHLASGRERGLTRSSA
jgi:hypothetical protein